MAKIADEVSLKNKIDQMETRINQAKSSYLEKEELFRQKTFKRESKENSI